MIPIDHWHAAIGCFNPCVGKIHVSNGFGKVLCRGSTSSYCSIKPFILVIIIVSSILLIMAGDVELNPGPRGFRKCPQCQQDIPIKSKTCGNCGLPQNSRKSIETKRTQWNKQYYQSQKIEILAQRENYNKHAEELKVVSKMNYDANPKRKKATSCARYKINPQKQKLASRTQYKINPQKQKLASRTQYKINPQKQKLTSVSRYKTNAVKLKSVFKANYERNHDARIKYKHSMRTTKQAYVNTKGVSTFWLNLSLL